MLNFTFLISHLSLFAFACVQIRHNPLSGGYCGGVPPLPIPNREVKPTCADGTAMKCGRVGSRLLLTERVLRQKSWNSFFCLLLTHNLGTNNVAFFSNLIIYYYARNVLHCLRVF